MKSALAALAFGLALAGCPDGGTGTTGPAISPLVGKWSTGISSGGVSFNETFDLQEGSTANLTLAGTGSCTGTQTYTGGTWSSTTTTLTLSGTPACAGRIMCTVMGVMINLDCSAGTSQSGTFMYTLSNNNNTLTLSTTTDAGTNTLTLTRQ